MIQCQLKLRMCKRQERTCEQWLYHLAAVWNFAIRKIELNAANKIYFSRIEFNNILAGHSVIRAATGKRPPNTKHLKGCKLDRDHLDKMQNEVSR